jgi:hypothetical protein
MKTAEWRARWEAVGYERRERAKRVRHKLSMSVNLRREVLGQTVLYSFRKNWLGTPPNPYGILAEISEKGNRRCIFVRANGMRCTGYGPKVLCNRHIRCEEMKDIFGQHIKAQTLREHYEEQLRNPNYKSTQNELALLRTMLGQMLENLKGTPTDVAWYENIVSLVREITRTAESLTNIEKKQNMRLSIEQLQTLIDGVVGLVVRIMQPSEDQLEKLAESIATLKVFRTTEMATPMLDYGKHEASAKMTTVLDAVTKEGVVKNAFTKEDIEASHATQAHGFEEIQGRLREDEEIQKQVKKDLGL